MPWYKAGTVSVTLNSNAVIGTGTAFIANSRVGDAFRGPDGGWYEVGNIASDTAMSISPPYQGVTNAAGIYALAPMQGYVKDSADALRSLVNTYGQKLAALGTTGNYDILPVNKGGTGGADQASARAGLGAAKSGANLDITALSGLTTALSVAQGGTGGNTQGSARSGLGLGSAAVAAIIGTVSQSGGAPTGALMEYGSNAIGEYWKFANGLMVSSQYIQLGSLTWTAGTGVRFVQVTAGLPVTFAVSPLLYTQVRDGNVSARAAWCTIAVAPTPGTIDAWFAASSGTTGSNSFGVNVFALGKWFNP
ncbi:phage tail protein [Pseudomonas sp. RT6P73]